MRCCLIMIMPIPKLKPTFKSISLRLPEPMGDELRQLASERDIPYQSLIKHFLRERIDQEYKVNKVQVKIVSLTRGVRTTSYPSIAKRVSKFPVKFFDHRPIIDTPQADGIIARTRSKRLSIWRKCYTANVTLVTFQLVYQCSGAHIP